MGGGGDTTTRQEMSPEARQIMMTVMGRANPLLDKPAVSDEQAAHRARLEAYYNSQDYKAPFQHMQNQGLQLMNGGVAGNPFNNGTRMMPQDHNIGAAPYALDRSGQRSDFNEVRNGAPPQVQGTQYAPPQNKMAQMPQLANKMQQMPQLPSSGGGQPMLGGNTKQPMALPNPNQPMSDDEFQMYMNRYSNKNSISNG